MSPKGALASELSQSLESTVSTSRNDLVLWSWCSGPGLSLYVLDSGKQEKRRENRRGHHGLWWKTLPIYILRKEQIAMRREREPQRSLGRSPTIPGECHAMAG